MSCATNRAPGTGHGTCDTTRGLGATRRPDGTSATRLEGTGRRDLAPRRDRAPENDTETEAGTEPNASLGDATELPRTRPGRLGGFDFT